MYLLWNFGRHSYAELRRSTHDYYIRKPCTLGASGVRVQAPSRRRTGPRIRRKAFRPSLLGATEGRWEGEFSVFVSGDGGIRCIEPYGVSHLGQFSIYVTPVSRKMQRGLGSVDFVEKGRFGTLRSHC